jgi:arylsulfatase
MGDWKAVRQQMLRRNNPSPLKIELYNLKSAIGESNDVAASHPDIVARMQQIMSQQHTPTELFPLPVLDQ